jgi:hypothetical protein
MRVDAEHLSRFIAGSASFLLWNDFRSCSPCLVILCGKHALLRFDRELLLEFAADRPSLTRCEVAPANLNRDDPGEHVLAGVEVLGFDCRRGSRDFPWLFFYFILPLCLF